MIKGSIHKNATHTHTSNIRYHKHMKQILTKLNHKTEQCSNSGRFHPLPPSIMNTLVRLKINKETEDLSNTVDQLHLTDIYRAIYSIAIESTFFSSVHGTFFMTDYAC